ncbi:hypothetical protein FACS1894219_09460 [Clostridia bacterium]|nr:hypothetical protein FACS1894219_09460 [Clostridia bacterium]
MKKRKKKAVNTSLGKRFNFKVTITQTDLNIYQDETYDQNALTEFPMFERLKELLRQEFLASTPDSSWPFESRLEYINEYSGEAVLSSLYKEPEKSKYADTDGGFDIFSENLSIARLGADPEQIGNGLFYVELANGSPEFNYDTETDVYTLSIDDSSEILAVVGGYESDAYKTDCCFFTTGSIATRPDGLLEITYDDSELSGVRESSMTLLCDGKGGDVVHTVKKRDVFEIQSSFGSGKKIAQTLPDFLLTTDTREIVNNITESGGEMKITYIREVDGSPENHIVYSVKAYADD